MRERHGRSNSEDFRPIIALPLLLGETTFSSQHRPTILRRNRRPTDSNGPLQPLGGGMPKWIDGIADTNCIATRDTTVAVIDRSGCLYVSHDDGATWSYRFDRVTVPSGLHICGLVTSPQAD